MANFAFNIAKGHIAEYYERVRLNDPTNAVFVIVVVNASTADATLKDLDDLSAVLADAGVTERNTNGWARKTLDNTDLSAALVVDDVNDLVQVDIPDQTWVGVGAGGGASTDLIITYDSDSTAGTDANIIPMTFHDFAVTPDGSDVVAQISANGILQAS